jgi:putative membrane protein
MGGMMTAMGLWLVVWVLAGAAIVALAAAGAVWAARGLGLPGHRGRERPGLPADGAQQILRRRYAAGEIDEDEYLRRLAGLSQH